MPDQFGDESEKQPHEHSDCDKRHAELGSSRQMLPFMARAIHGLGSSGMWFLVRANFDRRGARRGLDRLDEMCVRSRHAPAARQTMRPYVGALLRELPARAVEVDDVDMRIDGRLTFELAHRISFEGENAFMAKAFGVFMNMDDLVGKDFAAGLESLKAVAAERATQS